MPCTRITAALFFLTTSLSGCVLIPTDETGLDLAGRNALKENPCAGVSAPVCLFINSPVLLGSQIFTVPDREAQFFKTQGSLEFVDNQKRQWIAPARTLTDGASIPKVFIPVIGDPRSPEFLNAATLHDAYCGIGNEDLDTYQSRRWQDTHRMFFDTLVVAGTNDKKAKVMFAAVYIAGPRWHQPRRSMAQFSDATKVDMLEDTIEFIEDNDPGLNALQDYLDWLEGENRKKLSGLFRDDNDLGINPERFEMAYEPDYPEDPTYPGYPEDPTYPGDIGSTPPGPVVDPVVPSTPPGTGDGPVAGG